MNSPKSLHKDCCNPSVFDKLHRKYAKDLHDFIYYKYGEQNNPKDIVQTAFLKLWENCKTITPEKAKSLNLTKTPEYEGTLTGIKRQYLLFEEGVVFNVRSHEGYITTISV